MKLFTKPKSFNSTGGGGLNGGSSNTYGNSTSPRK
jgi:hypothetical protein